MEWIQFSKDIRIECTEGVRIAKGTSTVFPKGIRIVFPKDTRIEYLKGIRFGFLKGISVGFKGVSNLSRGFLSENEQNISTWGWTCSLRTFSQTR